jgi:capsule assembly protein Wzi
LFLLAIALSPTSAGAANADLSYVPLDHWSYQVFYRLASLGLVPLDAVSARPITRQEARRLVVEALARARTTDSKFLSLFEADLQRLRVEFSTDSTVEIQARGVVGSWAQEFSPDRSAGVLSAAVGLSLSDDWFLLGRVVGGDSPGDPPAGEIYTSIKLGSVSLQVGRASSSWGPSLRTGLLLSDNAGTLPLFRLTADLPQARLTKVVASLERFGGSPPGPVVLIATRLDWMVTPRFRLGFNESLVTGWGGPLAMYDLLEPIPVLSQIIAGYEFHDRLGQARDSAVAVDFDWVVHPGTRLYGVGFVNDMPERIAERLARIGVLAGVFFVDPFKSGDTSLRLEYSVVTNGTYTYPNFPVLAHESLGRSLGHWLGPDGDDLYVELSRHLDLSTNLQFSYAYTRHGPGRFGQPMPLPADWFLSGVVETRHTLGLQLQTIHPPSLETRYRAEIASVANQGNVAGANGWQWRLGLEATYKWPAVSPDLISSTGAGSAQSVPLDNDQSFLQRAASRLSIRHWSAAMTSSGPLSGPSENAVMLGLASRARAGDFTGSFSYDTGGGQAFWSVDLHYPVAQFEHGGLTMFAGWGGLTRHGMLGGTIRDLTLSGPRLGADFVYQFAPAGMGTPFYFTGELSSPLLRGIWAPQEGNAPFYYWTYNLGAGWQFQDASRLEAGYRGAVAVWRDQTPDMTILYWDGVYLQLSFQS